LAFVDAAIHTKKGRNKKILKYERPRASYSFVKRASKYRIHPALRGMKKEGKN